MLMVIFLSAVGICLHYDNIIDSPCDYYAGLSIDALLRVVVQLVLVTRSNESAYKET